MQNITPPNCKAPTVGIMFAVQQAAVIDCSTCSTHNKYQGGKRARVRAGKGGRGREGNPRGRGRQFRERQGMVIKGRRRLGWE